MSSNNIWNGPVYGPVKKPEWANPGMKADDGKPRLSMLFSKALLPAIVATVRVLEYGAKKYPEVDNWARVENGADRYRDAAIRHLSARVSGEIIDSESNLPHMAHAACSVLFALALDLAGTK